MKNSTMLSITAEYALRALGEMATLPEGGSVLGRRLAASAGIPPNYLAKILWTLGNAGLIDATRGSGGGYRLHRSASGIRLCEVVELFDRQRWKRQCFLSSGKQCEEDRPCAAHDAWGKVRSVYVDFLETTTIAQIAHRSEGSQTLVKIAE